MRFKDQQMETTGRPGLVFFSLWEHTRARLSLSVELPWLSFEETYLGGVWDHSLWVHHLALFCAHHRSQQPLLHQTNTTVTVAHFHDKFMLGLCCKLQYKVHVVDLFETKKISQVLEQPSMKQLFFLQTTTESRYMFTYHADLLKNNKNKNKSQLYKQNYASRKQTKWWKTHSVY